jgi:hypothetical protein
LQRPSAKTSFCPACARARQSFSSSPAPGLAQNGAASDSAVLEPKDSTDVPDETKNLASERPETVAELKKLLATHPKAKPKISGKARPDIR